MWFNTPRSSTDVNSVLASMRLWFAPVEMFTLTVRNVFHVTDLTSNILQNLPIAYK